MLKFKLQNWNVVEYAKMEVSTTGFVQSHVEEPELTFSGTLTVYFKGFRFF